MQEVSDKYLNLKENENEKRERIQSPLKKEENC